MRLKKMRLKKMRLKKRIGVLVAGAAVCLMAIAGIAWACTPSPTIIGVSPTAGPAGTELIITGANFQPGPVEIRWDTLQGPLLGTADNFAVGFTLPGDVTTLKADHSSAVSGGASSYSARVSLPGGTVPGIYYVVGLQRDSSGQITGKSTASVNITGQPTGSDKSVGNADLWQGFDSSGSSVDGSEPGSRNGLFASTPGAVAGIGLIAVGTLGFGGAMTAVAIRRRRSRSTIRNGS